MFPGMLPPRRREHSTAIDQSASRHLSMIGVPTATRRTKCGCLQQAETHCKWSLVEFAVSMATAATRPLPERVAPYVAVLRDPPPRAGARSLVTSTSAMGASCKQMTAKGLQSLSLVSLSQWMSKRQQECRVAGSAESQEALHRRVG